ncbi:ABC transporter ATP-binding protein [bacterium]|nr:ABC transporter ATP-binding protein [bacterium]
MKSALEIRDLRKCYGDVVAVDGLSLDAGFGEIVGLIGADGAGKSTAMRVTCALIEQDSGDVRVLGLDPRSQARQVKEHIGYMPQRFSLYPDLSVSENLRFFAELYGVSGREFREREERLMEFSRLGEFRARRAGKLSGGMKQKLALSCTLIHTPELLVLDEPTTGVDPVSRQEFWTILRELATEGKALLVSTPYMDEAELCTRIIVMHRGRVLYSGSPRELPSLYPWQMLEVIGLSEKCAREKLGGMSSCEIERVGDRLHVIFEQANDESKLRALLSEDGVKVSKLLPTIEETMIYLVSREESGEQTAV